MAEVVKGFGIRETDFGKTKIGLDQCMIYKRVQELL